ncbi:MAG: hypothetical protein JWP76_2019 [Dactylosporangium sp.]|nr:hypothetical protein [Dactylosporangium sp.]
MVEIGVGDRLDVGNASTYRGQQLIESATRYPLGRRCRRVTSLCRDCPVSACPAEPLVRHQHRPACRMASVPDIDTTLSGDTGHRSLDAHMQLRQRRRSTAGRAAVRACPSPTPAHIRTPGSPTAVWWDRYAGTRQKAGQSGPAGGWITGPRRRTAEEAAAVGDDSAWERHVADVTLPRCIPSAPVASHAGRLRGRAACGRGARVAGENRVGVGDQGM